MKKLICVAGAALCAFVAHAGLPQFQTNTINVASALASVVNGTSNSTAGTAFTVPQGTSMNIDPTVTGANTGTSNVTFGFNVTSDGTHFTTTLPISITVACNGTTAAVGHTNLSKASLDGIQAIRLDQVITTQTNAVTIGPVYTGFYQ